jgi:hypothetical protein
MARAKSFLPVLLIDEAGASHNCQHNRAHRIVKGARRLKVKEGRNVEHFCISCGIEAVKLDISKLQILAAEMKSYE